MSELAVGVDSGGSNTRLALRDDAGHLVVVRGARGNVSERGPGPVARTIVALLKRARKGIVLARVSGQLVVGAAGVGTEELRNALALRLQELLPAMAVHVVTDPEVALYTAFGPKPGMAVIVGTGTVMFIRSRRGEVLSGGGWGPLAGDVGGGHWLGRHVLAHVAEAYDGLVAEDRVVRCFKEREGLATRDSFKRWLRDASRRRKAIAAVAPVVIEAFEDGDGWASWLCSQAAGALGRLAGALAQRAGLEGHELCAVLVGGLVEGSERYRQLVAERCRAEAGIRVVALPRPPVEGALQWAERLSADQHQAERLSAERGESR